MELHTSTVFSHIPILGLGEISSNITYVESASVMSTMTEREDEVDHVLSSLVSAYAFQYICTIHVAIFNAALCLFGIVANIINVVVFVRMKFKETINIALLGLAISDLFSLLFLLWHTICFNPLFMYAKDVTIYTVEIQLKTGAWTYTIFSRITAFLTVYITLERCLCIAFPLKIKHLLTPKRVLAIIIGIYVVVIGTLIPNLLTVRFAWKFIPSLNKTLIGIVFYDTRSTIQPIVYSLNTFYIIVTFIGVILCSLVLIWKLNQRGKWLNSMASEQDKSKTLRDRQVIKMVIIVAVVFIVCFIPSLISFMAFSIEAELSMGKRYQNLFMLFMFINSTFGAINSGVNIFIYYKMSSKFATTLRSLSCKKREKKRETNG